MADEENDLIEPEIEWDEGCEISATVDLFCKGPDGHPRPILISHDTEIFFALTIEDAERLHRFLSNAIRYCKDHDQQRKFPT